MEGHFERAAAESSTAKPGSVAKVGLETAGRKRRLHPRRSLVGRPRILRPKRNRPDLVQVARHLTCGDDHNVSHLDAVKRNKN